MEQLIVIRTLEGLQALSLYLRDKDLVTYDTETTGLTSDDTIIGFSVCAELDRAYYVVTQEWSALQNTLISTSISSEAKQVLIELRGKQLIMQNGLFDCRMTLRNYGVDLLPSLHTDTLVLGHLLNENRRNGLKERGVELFGDDAKAEQEAMKASIEKNGGKVTKDQYELYKGDSELIARYGAKDALLTLKIFYHDLPILFEEGLDKFFYEDECMPLLRGPTNELNSTGLKVDTQKLQELKLTLEADCAEAEAFILKEVHEHVKHKFPDGDFSITSNHHIAWLLFIKLGREFNTLTDGGKEMCETLQMKTPYSFKAKRQFIEGVTELHQKYLEAKNDQERELEHSKDQFKVWKKLGISQGTLKEHLDAFKKTLPKLKRIPEPQAFISVDEEALEAHASKYKWVEKLLEYRKNQKLLGTYVEGIGEKVRYGIINPSFNQTGTTSGRYSSNKPNFQNLPRDDKRIKACIVARPGKVFVGSDYSQLEPRVFASFSGDERLLKCFEDGDDFYSVIGVNVFNRIGCSLKKSDPNSFAVKHPKERDITKAVALAAAYGTTAFQMARVLGKTTDEAQAIIDDYFDQFPAVKQLMLTAHANAKQHGAVFNLFGRPRRMPDAMKIPKLFGDLSHEDLDYHFRNILNLAMNHPIQSTGASIMNRAAIAFYNNCRTLEAVDPAWKEVKIVLQVHDEVIAEGPEHLKEDIIAVLKDSMENTVTLPGVKLIAEPKAAYNLADLK